MQNQRGFVRVEKIFCREESGMSAGSNHNYASFSESFPTNACDEFTNGAGVAEKNPRRDAGLR